MSATAHPPPGVGNAQALPRLRSAPAAPQDRMPTPSAKEAGTVITRQTFGAGDGILRGWRKRFGCASKRRGPQQRWRWQQRGFQGAGLSGADREHRDDPVRVPVSEQDCAWEAFLTQAGEAEGAAFVPRGNGESVREGVEISRQEIGFVLYRGYPVVQTRHVVQSAVAPLSEKGRFCCFRRLRIPTRRAHA